MKRFLLFSFSLLWPLFHFSQTPGIKTLQDTVFRTDDFIPLPGIQYDLGKGSLRPEGKDSLKKVAEFLKAHLQLKVEIQYHTDYENPSSSARITQARACSCRDVLVDLGVDNSRIICKGFGTRRPFVTREERVLPSGKKIPPGTVISESYWRKFNEKDQLYLRALNRRTVMRVAGNVQEVSQVKVKYFVPHPNISIRALDVFTDTKIWFASNHGIWGYTEDGGQTWRVDSIKTDSIYPEFRSIAVLNDSTVLLLTIASPAYLLKTTNKGKSWRMVYRNTGKDIFFDSMKFFDDKNGIAISDPVDGCFPILRTSDGGEHWNQLDCASLPKAELEEGLFASSNTNLSGTSESFWFATGGKHSRIFHITDSGEHFEIQDSPLPQGETMTGIYSIAFFDNITGIITGGNYEKADSSVLSFASTHDGGLKWKPIRNNKPFHGSCAQFRSSEDVFITGGNGTFRYNLKTDKLVELSDQTGASLNFYTLRVSPSGKTVWMAGGKGRVCIMEGGE
jgi:photosystem II stability/assembly factor-like uncharacterized protein/outer membrane protein OmpA-like peptidoglycan-associated protein